MMTGYINPKLETVGAVKEIEVVPSYTLLTAVIPEIIIDLAVMFTVGDDD